MRKLPTKGFYVFNKTAYSELRKPGEIRKPVDCSDPLKLSIVYCSGTTKGNFYWDPENHSAKWNFLMWTCVLSEKEAKSYDYFENNPISFPLPIK